MEQPFVTGTSTALSAERPGLFARSLTLMKPITWFGPMWAFLCGAVASGAVGLNFPDIARVVLGILMGGPLLCGASQVINDYFDREVDALNQPDRLIPAGLVSIRQVVVTIGLLVFGGLAIGLFLGREVFLLTGIGLVLAIAYSAPPFRGKRNGWVGNSMVAISYEGLAWMAGHLAFASLTGPSVLVALLYSFGSHGIMSINDYKSIEGDRVSGIRTIPVLHGPKRASWLIVAMMNIAQLGVIAAFFVWGRPVFGLILIGILLVQLPVQRTFVKQPTETYLKFSAIGVSFFVWGMMAAAIGLRAL